MSETLLDLPIDELMPDPNQPRQKFDREAIERLAISIRARGILVPLRVRRDDERDCWRVILGESRLRAARLAGLTHLPCVLVDRPACEADILGDQILENVARDDLRPMELARSLQRLKQLKQCTAQVLARDLGLSGAGITRAEALLTLPAQMQEAVDDGRLPESSAYELSRLEDEELRCTLFREIVAGRLSRDETAEAVRGSIGKRTAPKTARLPVELEDGVRVTITSPTPLTPAALAKVIGQLRQAIKERSERNEPAGLGPA